MRLSPQKNRNGLLAGVLVLPLLFAGPPSVFAVNETKALQLLVATLEEIDEPTTQEALLQGMLAGLAGRREVTPPDAWAKVAARLSKSESKNVRELANELSQIFGDVSATQRALKLVADQDLAAADRRRALYSLLVQKNPQVSGLLEGLLDEPELRMDAIRAYAAIENPSAPKILLERYRKAGPEERKAILETLATRESYAVGILKSLQSGAISREEIPAHVARSLSFLLGDAFSKVYGEVRDIGEDRQALMAKYKKLLTEESLESADLLHGRAIFQKTCASCHVLYGTGGKIGPDLTGSNRANLDYILLNSVDPSYDVPDSYKMIVIQTTDGRVLNGVIAEEDAQRVVLKTVEQPRVVLLKTDIARRKVSPKSMMPDGQLEKMKPQEVIDLIAYLQTIEQVEQTP